MEILGSDPINVPGADFNCFYGDGRQGAQLRVFHWEPQNRNGDLPLIFVAGWGSVVQGWASLIREMAVSRSVFYIETREKKSAVLNLENPVPEDFSMQAMAEDLLTLLPGLPVNLSDSLIAGSSLGSTALLEAFKGDALKPRAAFLIGPNSEFHFPAIARPIMALPLFLYPPVIKMVLWYLRTFRVDAKNEPEQMARYEASLTEADPLRMKLSALGVRHYTIWQDLETVSVPVALAYAETDKLHGTDNILKMAEVMPAGRAWKCPSNKHMHCEALAQDMSRFLSELNF